ncbi:pentatricopeptide repeat-containing protein [Quercus suber]|uniref:Pentatricopeptide repeat-containing protein n=1 Tax=Quercus suber TaxID=58331 RepID=A0AAW0JTY4_QUESU
MDARALLESVLKKNAGSPLRFFSCGFSTLPYKFQYFDQVPLVWNIYEHMIQKRTYPNEVTIQTMIIALCKEGNLQKYVKILDQIHGKRCSPSVIVNTSLILKILEEGRIEDYMVLLKRMLQAKVKLGNLESAWKVYEEMLNRGLQASPDICTLFIGVRCK